MASGSAAGSGEGVGDGEGAGTGVAVGAVSAVGGAGVPWTHLALGAAMLGAGFALYMTGRFGAGDAKLLAAAGVWIGPSLDELSLFLGGLAASAFLLSAIALLPFEKTRRMRAELPFAVAIAPPAATIMLLRALPAAT